MKPREVIESFYRAFGQNDHQTISRLYHAKATFEDPVFGKLHGPEVTGMWTMLLERSKGKLKSDYEILDTAGNRVTSTMTARYTFGKHQRPVINVITTTFVVEDGLITSQKDHFNFWRWSGMALGLPGKLLGWSPYLRKKVYRESRKTLTKFMASKKDPVSEGQ